MAALVPTAQIDFAQFYRIHLSKVSKTVSSFRLPESEREDIIQEVFLKAWTKLHQLRDTDAIPAWLGTITRRQCLNRLQESHQKMRVQALDCYDDFGDGCLSSLACDEDEALASVHLELSVEILRELVEEIAHPERQEVARAFYVEGLSVRDIAESKGLKTNTVLSHLRRFRLAVLESFTKLAEQRSCDPDLALRALFPNH